MKTGRIAFFALLILALAWNTSLLAQTSSTQQQQPSSQEQPSQQTTSSSDTPKPGEFPVGASKPATPQPGAAQTGNPPSGTSQSGTPQSKDGAQVPPDAMDQNAQKEDAPPEPPDDSPTATQSTGQAKHTGGKDDVDAIGNRDIGKRGLGNWYSLDREIAMGKGYAQQIESSSKMVTDPVVNEYVNRIGQNLVRNSDAKVPFTIKVIDSDEINAFALPGGFFYVNSGLILAADEEAELAGVMSHEIAHVAARHAMRQITRANWANYLSLPPIFVGGGAGYAARLAAGLLVPATFMKFSRGFEAEADYLGLQYMYHAGYDPQAFINFFEKVQAQEKKKPGTLAKVFASHPQTPDRIAETQKEIATILPPRDDYIVTTSEFDEVKARLAALENRHKLDDKDKNGPSLRRNTQTNTTNNDPNKKDDDRPTLQRRDNN